MTADIDTTANIDMDEIERDARRLRAEAAAQLMHAFGGWLRRRKAGLRGARALPAGTA